MIRAQLALPVLGEVQTASVLTFHTWGLPARHSPATAWFPRGLLGRRAESGGQMGPCPPGHPGQKRGLDFGGVIRSMWKFEIVKSHVKLCANECVQ